MASFIWPFRVALLITSGAVVVMLVINVFTAKESHLFSENLLF